MLNVNELKKNKWEREGSMKREGRMRIVERSEVKKKAENHNCGKGEVKGLCRQKAGDLVNLYLSYK